MSQEMSPETQNVGHSVGHNVGHAGESGPEMSLELRTRCPSCHRKFGLDLDMLAKLFDAQADRAEFSCSQCQSAFFVLLSDIANMADLTPPPGAAADAQALMVPSFLDVTQSLMTHSVDSEIAPDLTTPASKIEPQRKAAEPVPLRETFRLPNARPEPQMRGPISGAVLPNKKGEGAGHAKGEHEKECPRCSALNALVSTECVRCGIVFDRVIDVRIEDELALGGSREMAALWDHVMEDYEDLVRHERFVAACSETNALAYASKKYGHILIASPQDPIARNMRNRIVGLVSAQAEKSGFPLQFQMGFRVPKLNSMAIFMGSMLTVWGLMMPQIRNLAEIGIAMLALSIGIRIALMRRA
ncbi:MAG TPA: hypothetical protein PLZ57_11535 [Pseudobdellovibrionaceae bacterium]|mgnify:CR=1 FL=1|nr:hypothetical protein [Pseudobdellovibrionaceae bacterium]